MKHAGTLFVLSVLAAAAAGLAVRLPQLDKRPMHCDEANQAMKAGLLLQTGAYRYDPREHHGPSLYWLTLPSLRLSGARQFAETREAQYRIVPVVFGAGLILLVVLVSDGLGRAAAVFAAVLAAASPAMVFYSRYYIQETLLVCFTLGAIGCAWRYVRGRSLGWAMAAGAFVGLMHATKETWVLAGAAAVAGLVLAAAWTRCRDGAWPAFRAHVRPGPILAAAAAAVVVAVAFYSSFGTNWRGPVDSILASSNYLRRGGEAGVHVHAWYYYLQLLTCNHPARGFFWSEGLIVGLAAVGFVWSLSVGKRVGGAGDAPAWAPGLNGHSSSRDPRSGDPGGSRLQSIPFCRFLAFYTLTLTALYAAVPYKTPWCMLSFLDGMILLAGVGAWTILRLVPTVPLKGLAACLLLAGVVHLGHECRWLNFRLYADQRNPYAYAPTSSDVLNLAAQLERLAAVSPEGHEMVIHVVTPENYWPLPWYLRRFDRHHVGYWEEPAAWQRDAQPYAPPSVIIFTPDVQQAVDAGLRAAYNQQMIYGLRPQVLLNVYVREDLWEAFVAAATL
jgi:uncharacterized protein (TIGR03663 family)